MQQEEIKNWLSSESTNDYTIDYNDQKFQDVQTQKDTAITDMNNTYNEIIGQSGQHFQNQQNAVNEWEKTQSQLQQERTDFTVNQIQQQQEQAEKDYLKEQSGAYVDYQKQSAQHGVGAEQRAAMGMADTGYSESAQVAMYNTYQTRLSMARQSYQMATQDFNNAITEARLQNNSALAQIAYESLQQRLELSLQEFQMNNTLVLDQANKKLELENIYYNRWQDVLNQMNQENALAEQIRQYNDSVGLEKLGFLQGLNEFAYYNKLGPYAEPESSGGGGGGRTSPKPGGNGLEYDGWENQGLENMANSGVLLYELAGTSSGKGTSALSNPKKTTNKKTGTKGQLK